MTVPVSAASAFTAILVSLVAVSAAPAQPTPAIASLYAQSGPFLAAIEAERLQRALEIKVSGITVPHHLLAADLIARGFWAASGNRYDRVILLSPDHFSKSRRAFATTRRDIETVLGTIRTDQAVAGALLSEPRLFDDSDLFKQEHGVAALLPFVRHFFPDASIVPIVVSYASTRADWDAAVAALRPFLGPTTLVVQSTDYSHYLTHAVALQRDQEMLNIIAANDVDAVARLVQPDHLDSKGSQYIQMRLQAEVNKAHGAVIASRSSSEYSAIGDKTTSYVVTVYAGDAVSGAQLRYGDQDVVYFGGDTFIGRWLTQPLADPEVARRVVQVVRGITGGAPLIVNLEGVLLDDPPRGVNADLHVMHADLALPILKELGVRAAGLANNHSNDLGRNGLAESVAILRRAGITPLLHMQPVDLGSIGVVAVNFIGANDYRHYPVAKSAADVQSLCRVSARSPLVALVHWGEEYTRAARPADLAAAQALHGCGVTAIIGAHSHQAAASIDALQGGEFQVTFSLGNLLFDQKSDRASSALLELRRFKQGTLATRLIALPNLFELASGELARKAGAGRAPQVR
jgi:poly-gamma-glutamate synthesis protein (capsule biosynthesis protein)